MQEKKVVFLYFIYFRELCTKIKEYSTKDPFNVPFHEKIFNSISVSTKKFIFILHTSSTISII